jgi:hypothetical protein
MMEAAHTSETSVDIQLIIRQYIPEDSELQIHALFYGDNSWTLELKTNEVRSNEMSGAYLQVLF